MLHTLLFYVLVPAVSLTLLDAAVHSLADWYHERG
jgi:hypothetical protein